MRSTRTAKRSTTACLVVLAGLFVGAGGVTNASASPAHVAGPQDMPWGVVKMVSPPLAGEDGDMPWG
ncbi:hypothetical protein [Streptomyces sp. NPDC002994]|uniref:hypothetical protein n=1 Tax=Streptomyces sp. NPDC002994 TaxID=3154441 RepID=UPI0033A78582